MEIYNDFLIGIKAASNTFENSYWLKYIYLVFMTSTEGTGKRGRTRTHCCGHIVAHDVSWAAQTGKHLLRTQNVSEQNQKHFCVPDTNIWPQQMFPSLRSIPRNIMSIMGNICVRNNVSSFASTLNTAKKAFLGMSNVDSLYE